MSRAGRKRVRVALAAAAVLALAGGGFAGPRGARAETGDSLVASCMKMTGAGHATCRRGTATATLTPRGMGTGTGGAAQGERLGFGDLGGAYSIYRLVGGVDGHRRCRLQPTCSLFAAQAARRFGVLRGLLMGLARAQMSHSDQDGLLAGTVASDGELIFFDPVERWIHGAP